MIEEHFLGQRRALAQAEKLQHLIFLAGEVYARAAHFNRLIIGRLRVRRNRSYLSATLFFVGNCDERRGVNSRQTSRRLLFSDF